MDFLMYLLLGACSGVLAGLFGIGGGLVIVPVLVFSFTAQGVAHDVLTHLAVGTSLAAILFTSINSVLAHHKQQAVLWPKVTWLGTGILFGSAFGGVTAAYIPGDYLQKIIGVFAVLMSLQMFSGWRPAGQASSLSKPVMTISGGVIGWASAIFGIGGGSLMVPFLTWKGVDIKKAVATSAACGLPIAFSGALSFMYMGWQKATLPQYSMGFVYLPALFGIALTSFFFARLGAKLAHQLPPVMLKRLFALLLALVGANFLL
ncbi:sulfite exporter TauE/SafE family protein [Marinomonas sp. TW1]|uniref:sulfite exporter TauE/SafE family protein n=1 Tax=Marinomonas sp. TW1 TaxID=1561203 RepID=UPI0007AF1C2F|nr:sulfite exporter TauE/SafE family protein [Marinomonas sp. TW1]KZN12324.1 membrane protein [Marinomonas sp. TW1]